MTARRRVQHIFPSDLDSTICLGSTEENDAESIEIVVPDEDAPEFVSATSRYQILEEIGRGGMGVVYRATDIDLQRDVAVKLLLSYYADHKEISRQFTNEARIMGSLQHPGIAHVFEVGTTDGDRPFHAMQLIEGHTLSQLLRRNDIARKWQGKWLNIFSTVCQAMAYTHSQGIVHLDLKPANIMVGAFGEVHVMDWGLAKRIPSDSGDIDETTSATAPSSNGSNRIHGTLQYMAPEQARGNRVDQQTDVFCLGAILCRIVTGQSPYFEGSRNELLKKARDGELDDAFTRLDQCKAEPGLIRLAKNCLQPSPADRPVDATVLAQEMSAHTESIQEQAVSDMTRFFELSLDLFCIAGLDGYFRRINSNFSKILGYSDEELMSRPFLELVLEEDRQRTIDVMGQLSEGKPVVRFRNRYKTKFGALLEFEWTAKSIPSEQLIFAVARHIV